MFAQQVAVKPRGVESVNGGSGWFGARCIGWGEGIVLFRRKQKTRAPFRLSSVAGKVDGRRRCKPCNDLRSGRLISEKKAGVLVEVGYKTRFLQHFRQKLAFARCDRCTHNQGLARG